MSVQGEFAKVGKDFKDQDVLAIVTSGDEIESEFNGKPRKQMIFKVRIPAGVEKNLAFNQTSMNNLIDAYGDDTDEWVGKNIKAWVVKAMIGGELKTIPYLAAPDWEMDEKGHFYGPSIQVDEGKIDEAPDDPGLESPF